MPVKTIYCSDNTPVMMTEEDFEELRKYEDYQQYLDSIIADFLQKEKEEMMIPPEVFRIMVSEGCSLIRALRKHFNLTQAQLAQMVGIKQSTLSEIEKSNKNHSETIKKITSVLLDANPGQLATVK